MWLRFHRVTGRFNEIRKRLRTTAQPEALREFHGHLWLALEVDPALAAPELVMSLAAQTAAILGQALPQPATPTEAHGTVAPQE